MSKKKKNARPRPSANARVETKPLTPSSPGPNVRPRWIVGAGLVVLISVGALAWLRDRPPQTPAVPPVPPAAPVATIAAPRYAGGAVCATCHAQEHASWHGSDHDLAMQEASDRSVLGNFNDAKFEYAGTTSTFSHRDGKFIVSTDGPDGQLRDYEIAYTFGVRPLQQYLIDFPNGRKQALSIAWDSRPKEQGGQRWFHLYPNDDVKAGDWLHWTNYSQNWNFTCAECHSTDLKKNYDPASDSYKTAWAEINVSCEACHGPASNHVAWARKEGEWKQLESGKGLVIALDERTGISWVPVAETGNSQRSVPRESTREIDTCARCHARSSRLTDAYVHGKSPLDTHRLTRLDDDLYWHDGQMRGEVYNWGSFVQSKMYARGVTCSDCHDPHSLKLKADGNAVCAGCHEPAKYDAPAHTHHAMGTRGAACASCHMPTTTYMVVDPRHDHSMRIPRPDLSAQVGTPNACTSCHAKKPAQWAADAIAKWNGKPPAGFQQFAAALHAGSTGAPGARDALVALIGDPSQPAIARASAIDRLANLLNSQSTDAVVRGLKDPDASVRQAAVEALGSSDPALRRRVLPVMLDDAVLAVRIEAARALAGEGERSQMADQRTRFEVVIDEYIAAQTYNFDRPEGHMNVGNLAAARGDAQTATAEYQKALSIDPLFVAAYVNLADLYRATGNEVDAQVILRQGIKADPRSAAMHHTLGLALTRQKARDVALHEFKTAVQLAPNDARFAYVYAVALNDAGSNREAINVLKTALKVSPNDVNLLTGLVYFSQQAGDGAAAHRYLGQLRELDPGNPQWDQLQQQLDGGVQ